MTYLPAYCQIEGTWHLIAEDETTACGLPIPFPGVGFTRDKPDKVHCGPDATKAVPTTKPATKPKAKAKK